MKYFAVSVVVVLLQPCWGAPDPSKDSTAIRLLPIYTKLGFAVTKAQVHLPISEWERNRYGTLSKNSIFIKSRFPSGLGKDHFYRFTITEESFPDSLHAKQRLDSLWVEPPGLHTEESFVFPLCRGYWIRNSVVTVQTDVSAYKAKMGQLRDCIREIDSRPSLSNRKGLIDSVARALKKPLE